MHEGNVQSCVKLLNKDFQNLRDEDLWTPLAISDLGMYYLDCQRRPPASMAAAATSGDSLTVPKIEWYKGGESK